jgi:hypothetical protein
VPVRSSDSCLRWSFSVSSLSRNGVVISEAWSGMWRRMKRPSSIALLVVSFIGMFNLLLSVRYHEHVRTSAAAAWALSSSPGDAAPAPDSHTVPERHRDGPSRIIQQRHLQKKKVKKFGGRSLGVLKESDFPPPPPSPYEGRTPGKTLPLWAAKPFYFRRRQVNDESLPRICYVHVGKTAGSTIGCALGFQLHCRFLMQHPPGLLPTVVTNMIHSQINDCTMTEDYYLVTLRDPLERIKSWYSYEDLPELKKGECSFRSLNELALRGLTDDDPGTSKACRDRAYRALTGIEQIGWHAYNNYEFYLKQLPHNASIGVIRSEHMLDDWNSMEAMLGSDARARPFPARNTASKEKELNKVLTQRAQELVCAALCQEIQVYKHYLHVAVNLHAAQVEQSLEELRRSCPLEADRVSCASREQ